MQVSEAKRALEIAGRIQSLCPVPTEKEERNPEALFDLLITEEELIRCCRNLFVDGHYANAVLEAYKCLNNCVKKAIQSSQDGSALMKTAFSPNNPRLRLNELRTESEQNEQLGYMEIYSGCMTGIRNPRAHEHAHEDNPDEALALIIWANHLMQKAKQAKRARRKRHKKP